MNNEAIVLSPYRFLKSEKIENGAMALLLVLAMMQIFCAFNAGVELTKGNAPTTAMAQNHDAVFVAKR